MLGLQWGSLKTRVTFFTLVIFLGGVWSLSCYAGQVLRDDMHRQMGEQQFPVASFIAADSNEALDEQVLLEVPVSTEKQFAGASCALST